MMHDVVPVVGVWLVIQVPLAIVITVVFRGGRQGDDVFAAKTAFDDWSRTA